jgi:GNAT superfamily N-acetyltransferase
VRVRAFRGWLRVSVDRILSFGVVTLRDALDTDAAAFSELFGQFRYPGSVGSFEARLQTFRSDPCVCVIVAEAKGAVIGVGMLQTLRILEGDDPMGVLCTLIVDEPSQRRGVGTAIVEALEGFARERGCFGVVVQSGASRIAGHRLYRKLDYLQTGERFIKVFDRQS